MVEGWVVNTVEYTTALLYSDWLYFLWHGICPIPAPRAPVHVPLHCPVSYIRINKIEKLRLIIFYLKRQQSEED